MKTGIIAFLLMSSWFGPAFCQISPRPSSNASRPVTHAILPGYDQTIHLLEIGVRRHWDREHFRKAFGAAFGPDVLTGKRLTACGIPVVFLLKAPAIWDEQLPLPFEARAKETLEDCRRQRELQKELTSPS